MLLIGVPTLLSDLIVQALPGDPTVARIEAVKPDDAGLPGGDEITLVVLAARHPDRQELAALLLARPRSAVMLIEGDAGNGAMIELWPRRRELGELSPDCIRSAVEHTTVWPDRFTDAAHPRADRRWRRWLRACIPTGDAT